MDDGTKKHEGPRHEGPARTSPYPLSRLAPAHDLIDVAREIQRADEMLATVTGTKLELLLDEIHGLQAKAREILEAAERDAALHRAECSFQKRAGGVYHLYRRENGTRYFSMLSPEEWGGAPPHPHEGSFRLEPDMSWTPVEKVDERTEKRAALRELMGKGR